MKKGNYVTLAAAIVMTISGAITTLAAENSELDPVYVYADREKDVSVMPGGKVDRQVHSGLYEGMDFMEVPANISSYTEKTIKQAYIPARTFFNVVTNNPSVMVGGASTNNNVELQIRGIPFNEHEITINGLQGMMEMGITPMNWIERVDTVIGPNVVNGGVGENQSVSGFIDFVPKMAKEKPILDLTETYSTHRLFNHAVDWGQRFGDNNRWGVRINAEHYNGTTSFEHEKIKGNDFYINIDQRTKTSKSSFLFGYDKVENRGMPEVLNLKKNWGNGVTGLPDPGKVKENLMSSWTSMGHQRHVYIFSHEQDINDTVKAYFKAGYQKVTWPDYWDAKPVLTSDDGTYTLGAIDGDWDSIRVRKSLSGGLLWTFNTGSVEHKLNTGYELFSRTYNDMNPNSRTSSSAMTGNIYTGIWSNWSDSPVNNGGHFYKSGRTLNRSFVVSDTLTALDGKLKMIVGLRHQSVQTKSFDKTGKQTKLYDKSKTSPNIGIVYKVADKTSLYANYAEGLASGTQVSSTSGYKNGGEILAPYATKSYEFGVKRDFTNWATTLSFFHIKQPTAMDKMVGDDKYYVMDGETRSQGIEWNVFGKITPRLTATGGIMLLDAKYKKNATSALEGNRVYGTPRINATMALDWETPIEGLSVNGRVLYFGNSFADDTNKIKVPSWARFDLGLTYDTKVADLPMTFSLNAYNLFDRHYWSTTTGKWSNGMVMLNPGRTFVLSATMHL